MRIKAEQYSLDGGAIEHAVEECPLISFLSARMPIRSRLTEWTINALMIWLDYLGKNRPPSQQFYGWAVLKTLNAMKSGRTVEATPTHRNQFHVDIILNVTGDNRRSKQRKHAAELAAHSRWLEAPVASEP